MNAPGESICTSSMIYTRYFASEGVKTTSSSTDLMLFTLLFDAASISTTSRILPFAIPTQLAHLPQGSPSVLSRQLTARESIFAQDVLPVPREPVKR